MYAPTRMAEPVEPPSNGNGGNGNDDDEAPGDGQEAEEVEAGEETTLDKDSRRLHSKQGWRHREPWRPQNPWMQLKRVPPHMQL